MNRSIARLLDFLKRHYIDILAFVGIYVLVLTVIHFANRETVPETIEDGDFISYLSYDETVNGSYTGYMLNNEYVLKGEFVFLTGETYSGEWNSSVISGEGTLSYPGIGNYVGSFSDGKRNGNGKFTWENGDVYSGEWEKLSLPMTERLAEQELSLPMGPCLMEEDVKKVVSASHIPWRNIVRS